MVYYKIVVIFLFGFWKFYNIFYLYNWLIITSLSETFSSDLFKKFLMPVTLFQFVKINFDLLNNFIGKFIII